MTLAGAVADPSPVCVGTMPEVLLAGARQCPEGDPGTPAVPRDPRHSSVPGDKALELEQKAPLPQLGAVPTKRQEFGVIWAESVEFQDF